ncbi:MAG: putative lipid II flippase FtsW [Bacteriovoracia bacterium]
MAKPFAFSLFKWKGLDLFLISVVGAMVIFGLIMVYSASFMATLERTGDGLFFVKKQLLFGVLGMVALVVAASVPYRFWMKHAYLILLFSTVLLALVLVPGVGVQSKGASRWLNVAGFHFQPAEFAKFALMLFVARQLTTKGDRIRRFVPGVLSNFLAITPALLLLLKQPDFGSCVIIVGVVFALMFLGGVPKRYLLGCVGLAGAAGAALVLISPYRMARLTTFLNPWEDPSGKGFQILQSLIGLNNGKFWGVGLGNSKEKLFFLPEAHNDFIFAIIGEELGFLGVAAVLLAYCYFIYRGLSVAWALYKKTGDRFGLLLGSGITAAIGFQAFVNMSVVMGLLPTKGLNLPFISYGGSALLMNLFAVGILMNIAAEAGKTRRAALARGGSK